MGEFTPWKLANTTIQGLLVKVYNNLFQQSPVDWLFISFPSSVYFLFPPTVSNAIINLEDVSSAEQAWAAAPLWVQGQAGQGLRGGLGLRPWLQLPYCSFDASVFQNVLCGPFL